MADYVERQKVIDCFERCIAEYPYHSVTTIKRCFENLPAEDVVPVRHGRWVKRKEHFYLGDCGCKEWTNYFCSICDVPNGYPANYCQSCGAKMDLGVEE